MIHLGSGLFIKLLEAGSVLLKLAHPDDHTQNVRAQTTVTQEAVANAVGPVEAMLQFAIGKFQFVKNMATGKWDIYELMDNVKVLLTTVEQEVVAALVNTLAPNRPAGDPPTGSGSNSPLDAPPNGPSSYSDLEKRNIEAAAQRRTVETPETSGLPPSVGQSLSGAAGGGGGYGFSISSEVTTQPAAEVPAAPAPQQAPTPQADAQQAPTGDGGSAAAGS